MSGSPEQVAQEIALAYCPDGVATLEELPGGEINATFLVTDTDQRKIVLQQLSHITDEVLADDYNVMAGHLIALGWEIAPALKVNGGGYYVADEAGKLWRSFDYIESQPGSAFEGDPEAYVALGALLGKVHHDLAQLDYQPKASSPHFQNIHYYSERLAAVMAEISDPSDKKLGQTMLTYALQSTVDAAPTQLVHGDPRIANALFRNGKPFTFIDWDDLRQANPLIDLGDLLGSVTDEMLRKDPTRFSQSLVHAVIEAYYQGANLSSDKQAFIRSALNAGKVVALMGGVRRIIDSVEDRVFGWDATHFSSRHAANIARAQDWWQVYETLSAAQT